MEDFWQNITFEKVLIQLLGFAAMALGAISFQAKTRLGILCWQLSANVMWTLQFIFLRAPLGALMNGASAVRGVVFASGESHVWARHSAVLWAFCTIFVLLGAWGYNSPVDILPIVGTVFSTLALFAHNPQKLRLLAILSSPPWLIYDAFAGSIAGVACECFNLASISIALWRFRRADLQAANIVKNRPAGILPGGENIARADDYSASAAVTNSANPAPSPLENN